MLASCNTIEYFLRASCIILVIVAFYVDEGLPGSSKVSAENPSGTSK